MRNTIIAILICCLFFISSFFAVSGFNWNDLKTSGIAITADEGVHIASGYYYLKTGRYFFNSEHPFLVKDIAALPLLFLDLKMPQLSEEAVSTQAYELEIYPYLEETFPISMEIENKQYAWMYRFLFHAENPSDLMVFWSRWAVALANSIFLFLGYFFLRKVVQPKVALLSIVLIATSIFVLSHAALVTMDVMSGLMQLNALVLWALYLRAYQEQRFAPGYFLGALVFFALALFAKFSSLILLPSAFIGGITYLIIKKQPLKRIFAFSVRYTSFILLLLFIVGLGTGLHLLGATEEELIQQLIIYTESGTSELGAGILQWAMQSNLVLKGLAEYFIGAVLVLARISKGTQVTYFLGQVYEDQNIGGWYFVILYFTKMSWVFLGLLVSALFFVLYHGLTKNLCKYFTHAFWLLLIIYSYIYSAMTVGSNLQIGLRHIMPVVLIIFVVIAQIVVKYWKQMRYIFIGALLLLLIEMGWHWPNYLTYYNISQGYEIATDSNYDWSGQEIKALAKWKEEQQIDKLYIAIKSDYPAEHYLGEQIAHFDVEKEDLPSQAYLAVSMFMFQNNKYRQDLKSEQKFGKYQLVDQVGKTMLIFKKE